MTDYSRGDSTLYDGVSKPPKNYKKLFMDSMKGLKEYNSLDFWSPFSDMWGTWCDQAISSGNVAKAKYLEGLNKGLDPSSLEKKFNAGKI